MPIEKISNAFVRTVENHEVSILRDGENVVLRLQSGEQLTFTPGDLREIVDEFAKAPRKPRGPNKRTAVTQNGQATGSRVAA